MSSSDLRCMLNEDLTVKTRGYKLNLKVYRRAESGVSGGSDLDS